MSISPLFRWPNSVCHYISNQMAIWPHQNRSCIIFRVNIMPTVYHSIKEKYVIRKFCHLLAC
ncbi:hypothetical protein DVP78_22950 [Yersinia enterocolitica]|nr:hypothetical protein [Yersinia enterocolitica]